jgi:SAM-dependent methyltransferase
MDKEHEIWDLPGHVDFLINNVWGKPGTNRGRHREVLRLTANYVTTDEVLDAGCGMGHFYPVLMESRPNVKYWGFDNSNEMIKKAKEFFPHMDGNFGNGDLYNMDKFGVYQTVVCIDILIHLPDIVTPIKEMWKHTGKELIIVTRVGEPFVGKYGNTGAFNFPPDKKLISRSDSREDLLKIFNELDGVGTIDEKIYDDRSTIFRMSRK